jgi:hypothetical protein
MLYTLEEDATLAFHCRESCCPLQSIQVEHLGCRL